MNNDMLQHHGVKGMKWGIRKNNRKRSVSKKNASNIKTSKVVKKTLQIYGKMKMASLTDDIFYNGAHKKAIKVAVDIGKSFVKEYMKKVRNRNKSLKIEQNPYYDPIDI